MKWIKKGQIFKPDGGFAWSNSYAQIPRPLLLKDKIRIYYATRYLDDLKLPISQTSYIDVDKTCLSKILYIHDKPSLSIGKNGSFSQYGIHPSMLIKRKNKIWFFYQGWKRCIDTPYETNIGIAVSDNNGLTFNKTSELPIFGKSMGDPYFVNGVFIYRIKSQYRMWYSSGMDWIVNEKKKEPVYIIKSATSNDLITWERDNVACIQPKFDDECQNSATVVKINNKYHMWFCYRHALDFRNSNRGYRIGYAWSFDLRKWHRDDLLAGIDVSYIDNWDSQMICYPYVFKVGEKITMLYCGNYFGREGFGFADLDY